MLSLRLGLWGEEGRKEGEKQNVPQPGPRIQGFGKEGAWWSTVLSGPALQAAHLVPLQNLRQDQEEGANLPADGACSCGRCGGPGTSWCQDLPGSNLSSSFSMGGPGHALGSPWPESPLQGSGSAWPPGLWLSESCLLQLC